MTLSKRHKSQALDEAIIRSQLSVSNLISSLNPAYKSEQREAVGLLRCDTGVTKIQSSQQQQSHLR